MTATAFGLTAAQMEQVLTAAGRAPSLHNSQPWSFRLAPDRIEVHADARRVLPASDPTGREVRLACGAALFNLRLALARHGVSTTVTLTPAVGNGALAVLEPGAGFVLTPDRAALERAIVHRRTNRQPYFDTEVPDGQQLILGRAAAVEQAVLHLITDQVSLGRVEGLAQAAQGHQSADPAWNAEWRAWTGRDPGPDGVPTTAVGPLVSARDSWLMRDFASRGPAEGSAGRDYEAHPLLGVLCTRTDSARAQVQAGQAMERVLLQATSLGLAASFLSHLIEVEPIRRKLADLLGDRAEPQVVLRIGFGGPVPSTGRRPVQDCVSAEPVG